MIRTLLVTIFLTISGCATAPDMVANPDKSKLGVLIVAGEGFNSKYNDPKDHKIQATLLETSSKVAEYLRDEIETEQNTEAEQFVNTNANVDTRAFVAQLIAQKKRDGMIQVVVRHVKNTSENTLYLEMTYSPLRYIQNQQGETLTLGNGIDMKYTLAGPNAEGSNTPLNYFTHDFISKLSKAGYIGK